MEWLEFNAETLIGKVIAAPERIQIPENIKEQVIVDYILNKIIKKIKICQF